MKMRENVASISRIRVYALPDFYRVTDVRDAFRFLLRARELQEERPVTSLMENSLYDQPETLLLLRTGRLRNEAHFARR